MAFVANTIPTAASLNAANPKRAVGSKAATGSKAGTTSVTALSGTGISVTVPTGGTVKVHVVTGDTQQGSAGYTAAYALVRRAGSAVTDGQFAIIFDAAGNRVGAATCTVVDSPSAGTYTYDLAYLCAGSSGAFTINSPGWYLVAEVFGPA